MIKQHVLSGGFVTVRAVAFAGIAMLGACGAKANGPGGFGNPMRPSDGGVVNPPTQTTGGCATLCDNARRAMCGAFNENCVAACEQLVRQVPARCSAQMNAYLTCAGRARIVCASDGPEIQGCDAQDTAVSACAEGEEPGPGPAPGPGPGDRCLPDSSIPDDIAATLCRSLPRTPVVHDCPGGAPYADCVPSPSGEANVFCCSR